MSLVWANFNRGGSEKLAMLALADWCNDEGGSLHPSISKIAKKINVSESQARRIIHKFINEGYLEVIANHDGGNPGQSRHYKLNVKKLFTPCIDATPCTHATPGTHARDPWHPCAQPLAPMTPYTSLSINKPSVKENITKEKIEMLEPQKIKQDNPRQLLHDVSDQTFNDFLVLRNAKKAPITCRAIEGIRREAAKAGITVEQALIECCERNWLGFKAEWYLKANSQAPPDNHERLSKQSRITVSAQSIFKTEEGVTQYEQAIEESTVSTEWSPDATTHRLG